MNATTPAAAPARPCPTAARERGQRRWHAAVALSLATAAAAPAAHAWGDEGHQVVGAIASHYLQPAARRKAYALLAGDTDRLTAHDFVSETTWADRFRDSDRNSTQLRFLRTRQWHFVDIERSAPDIDRACFGHPALPVGTAASAGPAAGCVVDKIDQFAAELADARTAPAERLLALKFLLHFVGDVHQPLHAGDDRDSGGNARRVSAAGLPAGNLHAYWDTQFVRRLGPDPASIAATLLARITPAQVGQWSQGTPTDWAQESSRLARASVYATLPKPDAGGVYRLPASYVTRSGPLVGSQLSKAGVRLAALLNRQFGP